MCKYVACAIHFVGVAALKEFIAELLHDNRVAAGLLAEERGGRKGGGGGNNVKHEYFA